MIRIALPAAAILALSACAIRHVTPYVPDASNTPQTADALEASTGCFEAGTAVEAAICADPSMAAPQRAMLRALHAGLRDRLFGRDALLASQRAWLLALPATCSLPVPPARPRPDAIACLSAALTAREATLRSLPLAPPANGGAIAQYVSLRPVAGAGSQPDPALCADLARRAGRALATTGELDPAAMGAEEVAGSHGGQTGSDPRHHVAVSLYDANAYALFQRRARSVSLDGAPPAITPVSLGAALAAREAGGNQGGRFSAYASQTGDYGSLDVFRLSGRLLVLAADPWGSTAPAAPGEASHAGVWDIAGAMPVPACLFDTYTRPAEPDHAGPPSKLAEWRTVLAQLRDTAGIDIGGAAIRDQALLDADTDFVVLHMPLLAVQQAGAGWTPWLRHRHDSVLDTLFAWSQGDPAHHALFDRVFALMRPAAADLVRHEQTTQGLNASESTQATAVAIMELLYRSVAAIAPGLGADLDAPRSAAATRPRYPILAIPQAQTAP